MDSRTSRKIMSVKLVWKDVPTETQINSLTINVI